MGDYPAPVRPDDARRDLALIRQRRQEAIRLEAELAREEAALQATLASDDSDPAARAASRAATEAQFERMYGPLRSIADLTAVIGAWRQHIPSTTSLRVPLQPDRDRVRGNPAAPVVIIEYGDYQCPECAEAHELYAPMRRWIDDGLLCAAFRHFPLIDAHPLALRAAQAAEAAAAQGRFWEMHDLLMAYDVVTDDDGQEHVLPETPRNAKQLERAARHARLDLERFRVDIDHDAALERILEDVRGGLASGVNGTPTFYLNGQRADVTGLEELYAQVARAVAA
jgi:protein-disulfide isomerase